ncbi:hypothetical protein BJV78DRAFT_1247090 [Lactifluus subvellereus]|nr:hypothetical protein BJV78DRAFT_1247090 [Lactifluus subvellereus]
MWSSSDHDYDPKSRYIAAMSSYLDRQLEPEITDMTSPALQPLPLITRLGTVYSQWVRATRVVRERSLLYPMC